MATVFRVTPKANGNLGDNGWGFKNQSGLYHTERSTSQMWVSPGEFLPDG